MYINIFAFSSEVLVEKQKVQAQLAGAVEYPDWVDAEG